MARRGQGGEGGLGPCPPLHSLGQLPLLHPSKRTGSCGDGGGGGSSSGGGQTLPLRAARPPRAPPGSRAPGLGPGPTVSSRAGARAGSDWEVEWEPLALRKAEALLSLAFPVPWSGVAGYRSAARVVFHVSRHAAAPHSKTAFSSQRQVRKRAAPSGWRSRARVVSGGLHLPGIGSRKSLVPSHGRSSSLSFPRTLRWGRSLRTKNSLSRGFHGNYPQAMLDQMLWKDVVRIATFLLECKLYVEEFLFCHHYIYYIQHYASYIAPTDCMVPAHIESGSSSLSPLTHRLISSGNNLTDPEASLNSVQLTPEINHHTWLEFLFPF
ncbi:uncharacterized protein LOC108584053 [Papio anubis]|uniref:uncharacterized protein LOC108584053 n=1 Tax=Papio anubis TaxID=9555 RepID=UPI0012AE0B6A|nr:uncharacterized protein LOC108584053 [Papio anubis]